MTNPFDDEQATYLVLVNDIRQHSLWPAAIDVPAGWRVAHPADTREACVTYVDTHWTDLSPRTEGDSP
jgi:MbtH protein